MQQPFPEQFQICQLEMQAHDVPVQLELPFPQKDPKNNKDSIEEKYRGKLIYALVPPFCAVR